MACPLPCDSLIFLLVYSYIAVRVDRKQAK
jgi:hypothetical protein